MYLFKELQRSLVVGPSFNPFPHCTFDVAHLIAELHISPPQKRRHYAK